MDEGKKYVVYGMRLRCSEGTMENYLSTEVGHGVVYQGQPVMNANDHAMGINLTHFGDCNSKKVFEDAKKEADEKYKAEEGDGFFTRAGKWLAKNTTKIAVDFKATFISNKCELVTPLPWRLVSEDHTIDGAPALLMESICPCVLGGVISIVPEVEEVEDQEFEELKRELFDTLRKEPWNIAKIHSLCIQLWGTETGNKVEADLFNMVKSAVSPVFAFEYVERPENAVDEESPYWDYYRTNETNGVQRRFGFMDIYDHCGWILGMELDTEILVFTPEGSDKEYRLQFWKGSYGWGGAFGGEIGLYQRSVEEANKNPYTEDNPLKEAAYFDCVSGKDEIPTIQKIHSTSGKLLIVNDTSEYADNGDHYWNLAIRSDPGYTSKDLVVVNTLTIKDERMREKIAEEINKNGNLKLVEIEGENIIVQYGEFENE